MYFEASNATGIYKRYLRSKFEANVQLLLAVVLNFPNIRTEGVPGHSLLKDRRNPRVKTTHKEQKRLYIDYVVYNIYAVVFSGFL